MPKATAVQRATEAVATRFAFKQSRLAEWMCAAMLLGIGFVISHDPRADLGSLFVFNNIGIPPHFLGLLCTLMGALRIAALIINGFSARLGPMARAIGSAAGALLWSQMGIALAVWTGEGAHGVPIAVPIYICLTVGELISCYRASNDAARNSRRA